MRLVNLSKTFCDVGGKSAEVKSQISCHPNVLSFSTIVNQVWSNICNFLPFYIFYILQVAFTWGVWLRDPVRCELVLKHGKSAKLPWHHNFEQSLWWGWSEWSGWSGWSRWSGWSGWSGWSEWSEWSGCSFFKLSKVVVSHWVTPRVGCQAAKNMACPFGILFLPSETLKWQLM